MTADPPASATRFVSAGRLPPSDAVQQAVDEAYRRFAAERSGALSTVYPALAEADPACFGLAMVSTAGAIAVAGQARMPFTIMSVAKPFVFALACAAHGIEAVRRRVGVNATGMAFNSTYPVERNPGGRTNPMVNAGAIATTSLVPGTDLERRWEMLRRGLSRFAGHDLATDEATLGCARESNHRNRALASMLQGVGQLSGDAGQAVELYTRQSCLSVTAVDIASMGSTLADGGTNPFTGDRVVDPEIARATLAVMTVAGLYETSGDWLFDVGVPGKSGIGGGVVAVSPGKGALGTYSPLVDAAGNSVRGEHAARFLARRLGLDLFASEAVRGGPADTDLESRSGR